MCPNCRQPLIVVEYEGIELDHCTVCRGTWLDTGELELLAERAGIPTARLAGLFAGGRASGHGRPGETGRPRRCPRCRRRLLVEGLALRDAAGDAERGGLLTIDRCPAADGLWLDPGELAMIVRHCGGDMAALADFLGDLFRHELSGRKED